MTSLLPRQAAYVCRACRTGQPPLSILFRPHTSTTSSQSHRPFLRQQRRTASSKISSIGSKKLSNTKPVPERQQTQNLSVAEPAPASTSDVPIKSEDVRGTLRDIQTSTRSICSSKALPQEIQVLEIMDKAYQLANVLVFGQATAPDEDVANSEEDGTLADKDLLSELEEPPLTTRKAKAAPTDLPSSPTSSHESSAQTLCETIYTLLKDPKVYISKDILAAYVRIVCQLGSPEFLPEIFFLYANKPQPIVGSSAIQYREPSPNSPKNAIPQELSDVALDCAILQRDLSLAVAIIDTTVATRAFRRNKFIQKASLPLAIVGSTPIAVYAAADWVANWQNSLDPNMAKAITMMASLAYVGTLSTIGFVAVTTWNDHHERVRWTEGTPLRYRWSQEEERLYFDRIAMAWGFQRKRRRGEEMGGIWEELRDECGVRGMVLDKSDLLPGMQ